MMTIYKNGKCRIVPLVVGYLVLGAKGETVQRFAADEIERAIETVDEIALEDGCYDAVAA